MRVMYTTANTEYRLSNVKVSEGSVSFRLDEDTEDIVLNDEEVSRFFSEHEASEINSIYLFMTERGLVMRNKMAESEPYKRNGTTYLASSMLYKNLGQIYIPRASFSLEHAVVRLNIREEDLEGSGLEGFERVENSHSSYVALAQSIFPSLRASKAERSGQNEWALSVQLLDDGQPSVRPGVKVYAKTDAGYVNRTYAYTDHEGIARFRFASLLLEPGEIATVKFGFRYYSNVDSVKVRV